MYCGKKLALPVVHTSLSGTTNQTKMRALWLGLAQKHGVGNSYQDFLKACMYIAVEGGGDNSCVGRDNFNSQNNSNSGSIWYIVTFAL